MSETTNLRERWNAVALPGSEQTEHTFNRFLRANGERPRVLNCAIPLTRGRVLTDFTLPPGVTPADCLAAAATGRFPAGLREWEYRPRIRAVPQLPQLRELPPAHRALDRLPWFETAGACRHLGLNARYVRHQYALWQELRPRVLQGVHTTLILALPQLGFALTPHVQLEKCFLYLAALARAFGPAQLFPARFVFPDAQLGGLDAAPAPIFGDLLPVTGGFAYPVVDCEPEPSRVLARFGGHDRYLGYPFTLARNATDDFTLQNRQAAPMWLPDGRRVNARLTATHAYATLDPELNRRLLLDHEGFAAATGLLRGSVTHDGLPFVLPVELQALIYAVVLTHWRMELDRPGDLTSYVVFTRHAAIRGFDFHQRVEPRYSQFLRLVQELGRDPHFAAYPLATHLTHGWLGGNLRVANQLSASEQELGPNLLRAYYGQQLDWQAGVINLLNHVAFRQRPDRSAARTARELEGELSADGLAFHQFHRLLQFDSHLFDRAPRPASRWPQSHPAFLELDQYYSTEGLPRL